MGAKHFGRALVLLLACPGAAFALGLGDIKLNSALNAPLDADIELVGAAPEELNSLKATLASRETFARYGLEYPNFLSSVSLVRGKSAAGKDVLKVKSQESITEPFVTLLVDVNWGRGRLVREYTVLLDPPVFTPGSETQSAQVSPPASGSARAGTIERPAASDAAPAAAAASSDSGSGVGAESYSVRRGDTLSGIASKLNSGAYGATREQLMLALYRSNPAAFDGSMNDLRSGAILRVPAASALSGISASAAANETRRQYSAWRSRGGAAAGSGSGRLRLVAPGESGSGSGSGASATEVKGLRDRLAQIESELAESRRLLELKNAELADLQRRLGGVRSPAASNPAAVVPPATVSTTPAATVTPPVAPTEQTPSASPSASASASASTPAPGEPVAPAAAEPSPSATAATPAQADGAPSVDAGAPTPAVQPMRPRVVDEPTPEEPSFFAGLLESVTGLLGSVKDFWYVPVALVLGLFGFLGFRKFQEKRAIRALENEPRYEMTEEPPMPAAASAPTPSGGETARLRRPNFGAAEDKGMLVEESGEHPQPKFASNLSQNPEDTLSGDTGLNLDHTDPLAEADFHMAYGLYDQAADLVRTAIQREPNRRDFKLKLVEVFFVWGNRDEFLSTARELYDTRSQAASGEWDKIAIMGRQIAPEDPLFSGGGAGGDGRPVDLDLTAGEGKLDFDLLGDGAGVAVAGAMGGGNALDIDFGSTSPSARGDGGQHGEASTVTAFGSTGLDRSNATTRQMAPQFAPASPVDLDMDLGESPTVEQPALRTNSPTIRQKIDAVMRQANNSGDQTAEVALDDLGLDLGDGLDLDGPDASADAPTMVAGLDEESQRLMQTASMKAGNATHDSAPAGRATGGDWFAPTKSGSGGANSSTASMNALDVDIGSTAQFGPDKDLDIDLERLAAGDLSGDSSVDLDLSAAANGASDDEISLPALEPMTISEVGTKLDLARAYMDMGDPDGARSILKEVLQEGSVSQKQEAQRLLDSLPG